MTDERDKTLEPDAPITDAERAHATSFRKLVDGMLDDATPPPALSADERVLLETATMIRAGAGTELALADARRKALVDDALERAVGARPAATAPATDELAARRLRRLAPWAVAAIAAAAAIAFALRGPAVNDAAPTVAIERTNVPDAQRSRPSDALVGRIDRSDAHRASDRLDAIYADRSSGYRAVMFSRVRPGDGQ